MEQQGDKNANAQPLTDKQIAGEMLGFIAGPCIESMTKENTQLSAAIALVDDAISLGGIGDYMTVRTVIDILTDSNEVDKLIGGCNPSSKFHKNHFVVHELADSLIHLRDEGLVEDRDMLVQALNAMIARRRENRILLGEDSDI